MLALFIDSLKLFEPYFNPVFDAYSKSFTVVFNFNSNNSSCAFKVYVWFITVLILPVVMSLT
jgi:hypothetical protein